MAIIGAWTAPPATRAKPSPRSLKVTNARSRQTVAGASQLKENAARAGAPEERGNRRSLSLREGRRGIQERNCASNGSFSFISFSFQAGPQFLQTVTVAARHGVRRRCQQFANLFEGIFMPNFQDNHFPLFHRQVC